MRIARATPRDLDAALDLLGLLDIVSGGYYPGEEDNEAESPLFFDAADPAHLAHLWKRLQAILDSAPGFQGRVLFGGATLLDPRSEVIDPAAECIDLHPRLKAALEDAGRLDWLADVNNEVGQVLLPRSCVEAHPESLRAAIDMARVGGYREAPAPLPGDLGLMGFDADLGMTVQEDGRVAGR